MRFNPWMKNERSGSHHRFLRAATPCVQRIFDHAFPSCGDSSNAIQQISDAADNTFGHVLPHSYSDDF
jgi:hypothetical protein